MKLDAELLQRIRQIWSAARSQSVRSINTSHVCANWLIGQQIVEVEQGGEGRAEYGAALLKRLSVELGEEFGTGFSVSALQYMRAFYLGYPQLIEAPSESLATGQLVLVREIQHALRAHGKFQEIVEEANRPGSPLRLQQIVLEPKAANQMTDADVLAKRDVAVVWCQRASAHASGCGGKPWQYVLISHDVIAENMSLVWLAAQFGVA